MQGYLKIKQLGEEISHMKKEALKKANFISQHIVPAYPIINTQGKDYSQILIYPRYRLFHGTTYQAGISIQKTGLKKSEFWKSRLGQGIYFVERFEEAQTIAIYRAHQEKKNNYAVIQCDVQPKSTYLVAIHPPWANIKNPFKEIAIVNEEDIITTKVHFQKI